MRAYYLPVSILLTGILYIFFIPENPFIIKLIFKMIPMALIIMYALKQSPKQKTATHWLILTGLLLSSIGDATLHWFIIGLSAFLIGHLFYIAGFFHQFKFSLLRLLILIPLATYGVFFGMSMKNNLVQTGNDSLVLPVLFYIIAILMMAFLAFMTANNWVIVGSLLFIISDSILAWNKFVEPVPFSSPLIMITYYSAQFFIAHSLKTIERKKQQIKNELGKENIHLIN